MKLPILPLILGLSACSVGGALIYHYFRKRQQDDDEEQTIVSLVESQPLIVIIKETKVVSNDFIPVIVGRSSLSLKSLEAKTRTKISFEEHDEDAQLCTVEGTKEGVAEAIKIISQIISKPVILTEELEVSQSACGKIIGRCGEMLQEICRKSMAKVSVNSNDAQKRQVIITGTRNQVTAARALIDEKIREDLELRKAIEESESKREKRMHLKSLGSSNNSLSGSLSPGGSIVSKAEKLNATSAGGQMEVYVSAIASPSKFWLQMVGPQSTELDTLIESMTEYYSQAENQELHRIQEPYLDQIVAAMFKWDNKWYRAKVVAILPNEYNESDMVLDIYFLDYGDSTYVAQNEVFQLRTDLLTLRFQAIECFLANVAPVDHQQLGDGKFNWDKRAVARFEELSHVAQWEMLLCRVVCHEDRAEKTPRSTRESSPIPGVELYDSVNGKDINVAQELINEGLAVEVTRLTPLSSSRLNSRNLSPIGFQNGAAGDSSNRRQDDLDRFAAICENSNNENFENARKSTSNGSLQFLAEERQQQQLK